MQGGIQYGFNSLIEAKHHCDQRAKQRAQEMINDNNINAMALRGAMKTRQRKREANIRAAIESLPA